MKDLILISSYCDTSEKKEYLRNLVKKLNEEYVYFDLMIVSHTPIPEDIVEKCEYVIYDKKNTKYENLEIIGPSYYGDDSFAINSIYTCFGNPITYHIAIWRMIILGNILAEKLGYKKVHHIEYDTLLNDTFEFYENSGLLDEYDVVIYKQKNTMCGFYQAWKVEKICSHLKTVDDDWLKSYSENTFANNPETLFENLLKIDTLVFEKDYDLLEKNGNYFNKSLEKVKAIGFCFPFYNSEQDSLNFFCWNNGKESVEITIIYNKTQIIVKSIDPNVWNMFLVDESYDKAKNLVVMVNNEIKNIFDFDEIRDIFKIKSYIVEHK